MVLSATPRRIMAAVAAPAAQENSPMLTTKITLVRQEASGHQKSDSEEACAIPALRSARF
jgi:hypothetical protein